MSTLIDLTKQFFATLDWIRQNPQIASVYLAIASLVFTIIAWTGVRVGRSIHAIWQKRKSRLRRIVISSEKHRSLDEFFSLYETAFDEDDRFSSVEILEWLRSKARSARIDYNVLLIKCRETTVAIAIYMRSRRLGVIFIPYLALNEGPESRPHGRDAIRLLMKTARRFGGGSNWFVFELEDPFEPSADLLESRRRRARIRRFQQHCAALGLRIVFPELRYFSPPYHSDSGEMDKRKMILAMVVPNDLDSEVERARIEEVVGYVYNDIYVACIAQNHPERPYYLKKIIECFSECKASMSDKVILATQLAGRGNLPSQGSIAKARHRKHRQRSTVDPME